MAYRLIEELIEEDAMNKAKIDALSHYEMCRIWRFEGSNHPLLEGEVGTYFTERLFNHFGGFTSEISKKLGW